jgi:hypothetical protein
MANTAKKETVKTLRIPLAGMFLNRDTTTKGQRYVNVLMEKSKNPLNQVEKVYVMKRSGLANHTQPSGGAAAGRGLYYWKANDKIYSVFGTKIWADTTDLGVTLDASSGRCWFAETSEVGFGGGRRLLVSDGTKLYAIQTNNTVTTISTSSDADFPTSNLGCVIFHDNYVFLPQSDGQIWSSDLDSTTAWTSTSFIVPQMYGDGLVAMIRQKDQIIGLGELTTEFFFNSGATPGSPLQRVEQNIQETGCAHGNSIGQIENSVCYVAKTLSGLSVWCIQGLSKIRKISTEAIERILEAEGTSISTCSAMMLRERGHLLYILNLDGAEKSLVYDVDEDYWQEWSDTAGNKFNCVSATEKNGVTYLQDAANGRIYTLSPTTYQDSGTNFTVTIQTEKIDFDTNARKFYSKIQIIGDDSTGDLSVSYSDDDFANYSTARTIAMSLVRKALTQLGLSRRRSWKLTYTDNSALRLEAIDVTFALGLN